MPSNLLFFFYILVKGIDLSWTQWFPRYNKSNILSHTILYIYILYYTLHMKVFNNFIICIKEYYIDEGTEKNDFGICDLMLKYECGTWDKINNPIIFTIKMKGKYLEDFLYHINNNLVTRHHKLQGDTLLRLFLNCYLSLVSK